MRRRSAGALALALCALAGCGAAQLGQRPILREYRTPLPPRRDLAHPAWLAASTADELHGKLSRDGRRLLYVSNLKGSLDLWEKDLSTGVPRRLTDHVAVDTQPCWSPDERRIAFVSMRNDVKGDLFLLEGETLTALTDRTTADAYPAFSADGAALFFASGPEGQSRIERLSLGKGRERTAVTGWGATHPAPSPDGRYLAYTQFDEEGRGRIALLRLADGRVELLTTPDYHAGFPAFSADGKHLYYSRFVGGTPGEPLTTDAVATIYRVETAAALAAGGAARAIAAALPLTSGRATAIFAHPGATGLVFTTQRAGSLDIGLLPLGGAIPPGSARELLALALREEDPRDQLLALHYVAARGGAEAATARYRSAGLLRELEEFERAAAELDALTAMPGAGELRELARIDRVMLEVQRRRARERQGGPPLRAAEIAGARARLGALPAASGGRVAAHRLLREGDLHRYAGETALAVASYETLVASHPAERERCAEARLRLAGLFAEVRDPALLSRYYLSLFRDFPEQEAWLRRAAAAVLELQENAALAAARATAGKAASGQVARDRQLEALRALVDGNRDKPLFCALAGLRIAELEERSGRLALAIRSLSEVSERYGKHRREATRAAFELGRVSLALSARLRAEGRQSDALGFYGQAIAAYERIVRSYEPGHEHHARARAEYLRLSLLEAGQLERDGELALAEKRYRKMLELDPDMLQAHRKLCAFAVARGELGAVEARYRARLARDAGDAVAHYMLGYLATFAKPLDERSLARAEEHLQRAVDLAPQSPFGHMTLGWVQEMRERYLGQSFRGWLEEAIVLYERAYGLNDGRVDVQTEADLLVNQCSAFAHLGNGWKQALELCGKRAALKLSFVSRAEEANFHLTYGRAASATGQHDLAARELSRALELARDLGRPRLEAEATARLALSAHLRGDHEGSNRLLEQALATYREQGQRRRLAGLSRSLAYNLVLLGRHAAAREELERARGFAKTHGTPVVEPWAPIGGVGRSTAPFGFDGFDEAHAALALEGMIHATQKAWPEIVRLLEARLANRRAAFKARKDEELPREELLLTHRIALARRALGESARFHELLGATLAALEQLQTRPKEGFEADPVLFPLQVAVALSEAEGLLAELAEGSGERERIAALRARLRELDGRAEAARKKKKELLPERLALALESELALISFHAGLLRQVAPVKPAAPTQGSAAERSLGDLLALGEPFAEAVRLLRRVQRATSPEREDLPAPTALAAAESDALERGALAPLFRPLRPVERLRWHVVAGLNLAEVASVAVADADLASHPSSELLVELERLCTRHELGGLRHAVAAELAHRRRDARAMRAAVDGYLARSPLLDPTRSLQRTLIRRRIFSRAVALALREGDLAQALGYAEQEERRGFVEELSALPPRGSERARAPLARMLQAARRYRALLAAQDLSQTTAARASWRRKLEAEERALARELAELAKAAPRIAALFAPIPELPLAALRAALQPGEVAVTALVHDGRVRLLSLEPGDGAASSPATGLRSLEVAPSLAELRREGAAGRSARERLEATLRGAVGKATRAYVDLGRIDPTLRVETLLPGRPVVRLATLWELADAAAVRGLPQGGGLVVDRDPARAARLAEALGARALPPTAPERLGLPLEAAGFLVVSAPLRFDGGLAANARLLLGAGEDRLADLRLGASLGQPLRGHLLVLTDVRHTPGRERAEQVALARLVHAAGIPSLAVVAASDPPGPAAAPAGSTPPVSWPRSLRAALDAAARGQDLASALRAQRDLAVALYGDGGLGGEPALRFARETLARRARSGAAALNAGRRAEAVEDLEVALRLMDRLGDRTYLDGALLFLANAYTFLEDYPRAVPRMERLLALRRGAVEEARRAGAAALLAAQAKLVQALQAMAWLRMRSEQYDQALAANQQAIELFLSVKRPLLAQPAYDQRSIIAERKASAGKRDEKSMQEALRYARLSLETAQALAKGSAAARATVAEAALRLARLLRLRFSDYGAAMTAARTALAQVSGAEPKALAESVAKLRELEERARSAGTAPGLKQQVAAAAATQRTLASALETRVAVQLEMVRIHGAKGDYAHAVEEAEAALELVRKAGLQQDAALLELVNNLYYMGRYSEALRAADEGLKQAGTSELRKIQFYNAKGSIFAALGRTANALADLREALRLARKLDRPVEVAASHNNLGNALRLAGRLEEAKEEFQRALAIDTRQDDRLGIAFDLANLGLAEELLGRARDARKSLERALSLAREIGAPLNELKALAGLGRIELAAGRTEPALARFRAGLALSQRLALRNWSWRFHLFTARALRRAGKAGPARAELEAGLSLTEELPPRPRRALGAPKVEEDPDDLYDELVDLLVERGEAEAALDLSERARARSFVDRVSAGALAIPLKPAAAALARITTLQQELEAARATRARARPEEARLAEAEVTRLTVALATERGALAALGPGLPSLVGVDVWPFARLRPALERLRAGTRLVIYHVGERQLALFVVEGGRRGATVKARRVSVTRRELEASVARLREALTGFHPVAGELRKLHGWLIAPVLDAGPAARLVVVPSGPLHVLPFAALDDGRGPLPARLALSSLPSLNTLRLLSSPAAPRPAGKGKAPDPSLLSLAWSSAERPLSFAWRESDALLEAFGAGGAKVLRGAEATPAALLAAAPSADLIHVATHARYEPDAPLLSALELREGEVRLVEVLGLKLRASLVVLSACETGLGHLDGADGILGLHQAFLLAGARRTISSLFRVSDLGTALLMKHLFRRLARGEPVDEALRAAQNEVRRRFPHPAFWAGFRLDGAPPEGDAHPNVKR